MTAATWNIIIEQGATLRLPFRYETKDALGVALPVDLTGYSARMQVRKNVKSDPPVLSLTDGAGITLGPDGLIVVEATPAQTAGITFPTGVYDLELESPDGRVTRLVQGSVKVSFEVTR